MVTIPIIIIIIPTITGCIYLDHAGTTVYSKTQVDNYHKDLLTNLYGNPHSQNPSSLQSTEIIEYVRNLVLNHFGTDSTHYDVIFTSGCTAAMRLVSEIFPWTSSQSTVTISSTSDSLTDQRGYQSSEAHVTSSTIMSPPTKDTTTGCSQISSIFCYLEDNHTSVIGIREVAANNGAQLVCINEESIRNNVNRQEPLNEQKQIENYTEANTISPITYHLFAYPAQSNFNGRKYPLAWTKNVPNYVINMTGFNDSCSKWLVLLDAAAFAATNPLDLTEYPAHFVTLSFYKLFGFPTGLGALIVRQDIGNILKKTYFGGGSVMASIAGTRFVKHRTGIHERWEH